MIHTRAELQLARRVQRAADVARPDRRRQAVANAVRPGDRLGVVAEPLHGDDRAEDLLLDDLVVLGDVGDDGRLHEEAAVAVRPAAGQHGRALRALEEAEHAVLLVLRDHRAHLDLVAVGRVADLERLDGRHERLEQRVVDLRAGEDARAGGAVLARVRVAGDLDPFGDRCRVGVVEHDHRRLAAELEVNALERVGRVPRDQLAGRDVAGERDEADVRVLDEALARSGRRRR